MSSHDTDAGEAPDTGTPRRQGPAAEVAAILVDHHLMSLATLRPDGWPQATIVNYLADGLALYFLVARESQKLANILRDPRVSIAIGGEANGAAVGLSMAAMVTEVDATRHVEALNRRIWMRTETQPFTPHPASHDVAVLRATPRIISLIDYSQPPGRARLYSVSEEWRLDPL